MLGGVASWAVTIMEKVGYLGLGFLVALENVFPPIPSEIVLPLAGFLTGQDKMNFALAVVAATTGSLVGALILYYVGCHLGRPRLMRWTRNHGKWLLITEEGLEKSFQWFSRHGYTAVLLGRCVPGIRSFISIPAGVQKMPLPQFVLYTTLGSGAWNLVLIGLGWWLGERWELVGEYVGYLETLIWVALGAGIAWLAYKKWEGTRKQRATS